VQIFHYPIHVPYPGSKNELIGKGLAVPVRINRGYKKGNITLFEITPAGMVYAKIDKVEISGKDGLEHKYWQHIIRAHFQKQGFYTVIGQCFCGKNVDVGLEKNGAKWAVEIELSPDNILVNVEKDAAACQKIIICVRSEKSKEDYEDRVKASFSGEFIQKVTFEILGNFIPV